MLVIVVDNLVKKCNHNYIIILEANICFQVVQNTLSLIEKLDKLVRVHRQRSYIAFTITIVVVLRKLLFFCAFVNATVTPVQLLAISTNLMKLSLSYFHYGFSKWQLIR